MELHEITVIPNEYAAKGIVMCHPETSAALQIKLAAADRHAEEKKLTAVQIAGLDAELTAARADVDCYKGGYHSEQEKNKLIAVIADDSIARNKVLREALVVANAANADLQQRLDAAEEALKGAQGEVDREFIAKRIRVLARVLDCENAVPDDATAVACVGTVLGSFRRAAEDLVGERDKLKAHGKKCAECVFSDGAWRERALKAESALTAANSRVTDLTAEVERLSRAMEFQGCMTVDEVNQKATELIVHLNCKAEAANSRVERLREALRWALDWIDAVPPSTALPAMPGFDREYVNDLLAEDAKEGK